MTRRGLPGHGAQPERRGARHAQATRRQRRRPPTRHPCQGARRLWPVPLAEPPTCRGRGEARRSGEGGTAHAPRRSSRGAVRGGPGEREAAAGARCWRPDAAAAERHARRRGGVERIHSRQQRTARLSRVRCPHSHANEHCKARSTANKPNMPGNTQSEHVRPRLRGHPRRSRGRAGQRGGAGIGFAVRSGRHAACFLQPSCQQSGQRAKNRPAPLPVMPLAKASRLPPSTQQPPRQVQNSRFAAPKKTP